MIFVDTNVWMYAVGRSHPLQPEARAFFAASLQGRDRLVISAEVLQELLHAYLPVSRMQTLEAAMNLVAGIIHEVWPVEEEDVRHAHAIAMQLPHLGARDLLHLATCRRRGVSEIKTFDRGLAAAFAG